MSEPSASQIDHARAAVREAGRISMRYFRQDYRRWDKGPGQVVTEADIAVDRFLSQELRRPTPEDGWLSEETEDDPARLGKARVWVVDPIDGTRSFVEGAPEFTISVALVEDGEPTLGFVFNPATDELFEARAGAGATLNGARMAVSAADQLRGARIVASKYESRRRDFAALIPKAELSTIGSLAYKLALVAAGRFDGYMSWRKTHDWDIAAAALLLAEAGGTLTDATGGPIRLNQPLPRHQGLLAGGRQLHAALLQATVAGHARYLDDREARGLER